MISTGEMPCDDRAGLWAAMGDGKRCAACAEPIAAREVEYKVNLTSGKKILLHQQPCHAIWLQECGPDTPTSGRARGVKGPRRPPRP
jgi:hypothetical protein